MPSTAATTATYARWTVAAILGLFVVQVAVPHSAKLWVFAALVAVVVVLLLILGAWWFSDASARRGGLLLPGVFAAGLLASILYLRSLPEAAIPLAGVGALLICLVGLAVTGLRLRAH